MEFGMNISFFVLFFFVFSCGKTVVNSQNCGFPAVFNFGDSNSDTGGAYTVLGNVGWPNGMTVGREFKRYCDGRLIIDYLVESLGLPYLNSTFDKNGTSYRYGANFAVGSQRINPDPDPNKPHNWDYPLSEQVSRFFTFKSNAASSQEPNMYPKPEAFSEALYTIDIGQNDLSSMFGFKPISSILDFFTEDVKRLLDGGAKYMWIHNSGPFGCLPLTVNACSNPNVVCTRDNIGCFTEKNQIAKDFNSQLKQRVDQLKTQYPNAAITHVDMYSAKYSIVSSNAFDNELKFKFCCGNAEVFCAQTVQIGNRTVFGKAECTDASKYISWDGAHYTQAANKAVANLIVDGAFSEPRVGFSKACQK